MEAFTWSLHNDLKNWLKSYSSSTHSNFMDVCKRSRPETFPSSPSSLVPRCNFVRLLLLGWCLPAFLQSRKCPNRQLKDRSSSENLFWPPYPKKVWHELEMVFFFEFVNVSPPGSPPKGRLRPEAHRKEDPHIFNVVWLLLLRHLTSSLLSQMVIQKGDGDCLIHTPGET